MEKKPFISDVPNDILFDWRTSFDVIVTRIRSKFIENAGFVLQIKQFGKF